MQGGRAYYYHYHPSRRCCPAKALHDRLCQSTTAWVSTATYCELAFTAGAELFANAYDTYESPFGDGGIIPMPAGTAAHGGDSPSFSQIMKLNSAERQPREDAMSKEIKGLRQAGAIESEEIYEDSLPSWDGRRATEVIDGLWVNTTKRGPDARSSAASRAALPMIPSRSARSEARPCDFQSICPAFLPQVPDRIFLCIKKYKTE